jgi:hypothetical protein
VSEAYRKDFWERLPVYVHVFCEKEAMAGMLTPTTRQYDVSLPIVRGFSGISYLHEAAAQWREIEKPIFAYYLGDFDPSGLDLERDIHEKLRRYAKRDFAWKRLAVNLDDFSTFNLFPLTPKSKDTRTQALSRTRLYAVCRTRRRTCERTASTSRAGPPVPCSDWRMGKSAAYRTIRAPAVASDGERLCWRGAIKTDQSTTAIQPPRSNTKGSPNAH